MTEAETAVRKPTAKELAEEAMEIGQQLRAELTELRDQVREGGMVTRQAGEHAPDPRIDTINREFNEFVDHVNKTFAQIVSGPATVAIDPEVVRGPLAELEAKVAESFTAYSKIVDSHNTAASNAIEELREKIRLFDEAGLAPASAEDVDSLDNRLKGIEQGLSGTATSADLNEIHVRMNEIRRDLDKMTEHVAGLTVPLLRGAAAERALSSSAPTSGGSAIYGQVHRLMNAITELGKDQTADKKMGGYAFRSIDAAMDVVGRALREVGVMFQPREIVEKRVERYEIVSKDGYRQNWTHVWVTQRYAFVSLIDGSEMIGIEMDGEARDNGDKSTSKADSMRLKYALLQALMIPVNGLPESDGRDGTEGAHVYGRGDADESWENATPARPSQQETAYGYGHQPAESPGGQAHAQAAQEPEEDTRTPEEKATAAYHALVALAGLEKPEQRPRLNKILGGIVAAGIGNVVIETADGRRTTLDQYAATVNSQVGA